MSAALFTGIEELVTGAGVPFLLSLTATGVQLLRNGWRGWRRFAVICVTAIFVGQIVWWGLDYDSGIPFTVKAAISGACAFASNVLLDAFVYRIRKEVREGRLPRRHHGDFEG